MNAEYFFQAVLIVASVGLAVFCLTLSRRLRRLNDLETGLGGAIAVMAAEVDRLEVAMRMARDDATAASEALLQNIGTARKERALWDLRQKIDHAVTPETTIIATRRLRKRVEGPHA
ncbi:hypothetical protein H4P12_08585 [Paracoccus sp. 11-3]|uniref:Uncharacterized protein n=1 Tax=Paracoccus amoyensis TaxID=2760093 RepID=A0A926GEC3_9RHOB|nr:hypothetical protein [Paracoccus amoyensis]MBC9246767.1 hypothetical protein [Paracoccus amoyensis]